MTQITMYGDPGNLTHLFQLNTSGSTWAGYCTCGEVLGWRYPRDGHNGSMWESLYRRHMWAVLGEAPMETGRMVTSR